MAVVKVTEVVAPLETRFGDAVKVACAEVSQTVLGSLYIADMQAIAENDHVVRYHINTNVSFLIGDDTAASDALG